MKRKIGLILTLGIAVVALGAAAAVTHNIVQSYQTSAGSLTGTTVVTDTTELNTDVTLATAATNTQVNLAITRSQLKSLCLYATSQMTVLVNSTSAPANTFTLTAAAPQIGTGSGALALAADVTSLWLTCTNTNECVFSLRAVLHTTVP